MLLQDHKKLQRLMIVQGISVRGLAVKAGYRSHTQVWRLAHGVAEGCEIQYAKKIAECLEVDLKDLFTL